MLAIVFIHSADISLALVMWCTPRRAVNSNYVQSAKITLRLGARSHGGHLSQCWGTAGESGDPGQESESWPAEGETGI